MNSLKNKTIHIIGIGGIGMSAIAKILHKKGFKVSGSVDKMNVQVTYLREMGMNVSVGHAVENVKDCDVVLYSTSISEDHVERKGAVSLGKPTYNRKEFFPLFFEGTQNIAISGTHGKTTTSTMVGHMFRHCNEDVSVLIGAMWEEIGSNETVGSSPYFVVEADESDGSFLGIPSYITVVNNVDKDHMNYYKDMDDLVMSYERFINQTLSGGIAFVNGDDERLKKLLPSLKPKVLTYGLSKDCDIVAYDVRFKSGVQFFKVRYCGKELGEFQLNVLGTHNVSNSLVAMGVGLFCGQDVECIRSGLPKYRLPSRRVEKKGTWRKMDVIDDYAHHPEAIRKTSMGLRDYYGKFITVFQPHRYSRTGDTFEETVEVLKTLEKVYLLPLYSAGEEEVKGINSLELAKRSGAIYVENYEILKNHLMKSTESYSAVVFMGAGDITEEATKLAMEEKR